MMAVAAGLKPTLGLFITSAEDKYENAVLRSVYDVARAAGNNLICFTSGALRSYHGFEAQRNVLYGLVNSASISGLVISGTLSHNVSLDEMLAFCRGYEPLPMVSVELSLQGIPCVKADSGGGIRAATEHLILAHGFQRIVFIRGPEGQQEAEDRYRAYQETLEAHHIPLDIRLVLNGDYTHASGEKVMGQFLSQEITFDGIVSANDSMALGAIEVLRQHGKRIPEDVAVCGFDDTEEGRFLTPALTSVRQSIYEQGHKATNILLARMAGESVPEVVTLPSILVVRRSCGCNGINIPEIDSFPNIQIQTNTGAIEPCEAHKQVVLAALQKVMAHLPTKQVDEWVEKWLSTFSSDLLGKTQGAFVRFLEDAAIQGTKVGADMSTWNAAIDIIRSLDLPEMCAREKGLDAEALWTQGREHIADMAEKIQVQLRTQIEQRSVALREIGETMMTTAELNELLDVLALELPRLGIAGCFLSLYENPHEPAEQARLVLAYDKNGRIQLPAEGILFPSPRLAPELIWERLQNYGLVVEALYSKEDQLGFVLFDVLPENAAVCSALRGQLSSALQGVLLLQERRRVETELREYQSKLEEKVMIRTRALRKTNVQLQKEVAERKQAQAEIQQLNADLEKRVAERTAELESANKELESFSYSVSHDLRAPLRAMNGFARILEEEYAEQLGPEGRQYLERMRTGARRMGQLIDDLLMFSRLGRQPVRKQTIAPAAIVQQVLDELRPMLANRQPEIEIQPLPPCQADPALLRQVFANLLGNAIKYSSKRESATIEVGWLEQNDEIVYFVRDNGAGFDMRYAQKLFGVFQRLHREDEFEGTGVGLATVQRILQRHGGRIWAEGQVGVGATFYFTIGKAEI
jgi:DNA-binding LacI/PurR family transcriptional regulator/signal transduction histidine kinase